MPDEPRKPARPRVPAPPSPQRAEQRIDLDWRAYFIEFCRTHGEPVEWEGRLLFRDGWTYSRTDYRGPEWGPPADLAELDRLVSLYWRTRHALVKTALDATAHKRNVLHDLAKSRSLPLQQATKDEHGNPTYRPLNTAALDARIEWLCADLRECEQRLKELEDYKKGGGDVSK